ncbi:recombinase family protein [Shinella zoogloeoides]|uniref:recombinase family protein n=1 Tax=Shinella zoogloeoides TaxID=352475 RepID=UPI0028AFB075|nr:recombinase family protein [Shinella zoogloeoides]
MPKNVIFYARYSTDRQDEQSIETQIELGRALAAERGWNLVEIYEDRAVSGTKLKSRPGIQQVLRRIRQRDVDILLCVSVDRISRDMEHSSGILKQLRHYRVELWTVQAKAPVADIELGLRSIISHDMIEQTRYRTREGMKTTVRKGKAAGGIAYGYRIKLEYDAKGDRVPGMREINEEEAEIVRWIYQQYALGRSPKELAVDLNNRMPPVPGPKGAKWRDTAIRGHRDRGAGILNNETYIGRIVYNRRRFDKNPETESREARLNDRSEWVVGEAPELRIVDDELWTRVKRRQMEVEASFSQTTTNRLNRAHRPQYVLSGLLECAHCAGPYAVMAKDRYGCTNRQKKLPIDHLGNIVCTNSKTIARQELEQRVLDAIPDNLLSTEQITTIQDRVNKQMAASRKAGERSKDKLEAGLREATRKQEAIANQITERLLAGQPKIDAFDRMLDELQKQCEAMRQELDHVSARKKAAFKPFTLNPSMCNLMTKALTMAVRAGNSECDAVKEQFNIVRELVQKVVIAPSPDGKSADLTIHGRLASILASMKAFHEHSKAMRADFVDDYAQRLKDGELKGQKAKLDFVARFRSVLAEEEADWKRLQVSVVAGAGFEPAAFRL